MAESINIQPKVKGNKFTAEEFNEVLNKTNAAIQELNSDTQNLTGITETVTGLTETVIGLTERVEILETGSTALTSVTWTAGQPMPEIAADIIVGTISEGETKYIQTGLLGNQTFAILSSPNVELASTKFTSKPFTISDTSNDRFAVVNMNYAVIENYNTGVSRLSRIDDIETVIDIGEYSVSDSTTILLFNDYIVVFDDDNSTCLFVIDRTTNEVNIPLSVKGSALVEQTGFNRRSIIKVSDTQFAYIGWENHKTTYDAVMFTLDLNLDVINSRVLSTHDNSGSIAVPEAESLLLKDNKLYEFYQCSSIDENSQFISYDVIFKRYDLLTNSYDDWGNTKVTLLASETVLGAVIHNRRIGLTLFSLNDKIYIGDLESEQAVNTVLIDVNDGINFLYTATTVPEDLWFQGDSDMHRVFLNNNKFISFSVSIDERPRELVGERPGEPVGERPGDFTVNGIFTVIDDTVTNITSQYTDKGLLPFGPVLTTDNVSYQILCTDLTNYGAFLVDVDANLNPNITVTKIVDYYAKAATFHKAIISPNGKVYIPADAEIAKFISTVADNNTFPREVFWFNNDTEAFELIDVTEFSDGSNFIMRGSSNDIIMMRLGIDGFYYKMIGVNADGSLTDISSLIAPNHNTDADSHVYVQGGIIALSQNEGQYQLVFNPETDNILVNLRVSFTGDSYSIEKLSEDWYAIHEVDMSGYTVIKILVQWSNPSQTSVDNVIDLTEVYTAPDSQPFRLLRTIPGSVEYYDINADYPLLPGLYMDIEGGSYIVFNGDPEMYSVNDLINLNSNMYNVRGLVDSSTRKILICTYGKSSNISFFDVDTQEFIEPTYIEPDITLEGYKYSIYNNVHELSDGSFIAKVDGFVFTSPNLRSWTMIIGTYKKNKYKI